MTVLSIPIQEIIRGRFDPESVVLTDESMMAKPMSAMANTCGPIKVNLLFPRVFMSMGLRLLGVLTNGG